MNARLIRIAFLVAVLGVAAAAAVFFRANLTAPERGRRLAEANGCFGCHGPEGIRGTYNPGRDEGKVPDYEGSLMMYAETAEEVREWIRDGAPKARRESTSWQEERRKGVLRMPDFGDKLPKKDIEDLVAFVLASAGLPAPEDSVVVLGRERAHALGCFGCHGVGGRLARPNPGSLKGYVPPWDGPDFPDLVQSRAEFGEWVENGVSERFRHNAPAQFFLRRGRLHMPAYRVHLESNDVDALWAYVTWLRTNPKAP
ncbi:MAG: c-type cytochrome [Candidatus Eiseniibacteriota bacterium]